MPVSLQAQLSALRLIEQRGQPAVLRRAGFVSRSTEGALLHEQITAARETIELVCADESLRKRVEKARCP